MTVALFIHDHLIISKESINEPYLKSICLYGWLNFNKNKYELKPLFSYIQKTVHLLLWWKLFLMFQMN